MSRSGNIVRTSALAMSIVAICQLYTAGWAAPMNSRASHAEHMLSLLHDNFIAEASDTLHLLSKSEGVYLVIWRFEMEVYNGGILQFFSNSSGSLTPHLKAALRTIGAENVIPIVDDALAVVGSDLPWEDDARRFRSINALSSEKRSEIWSIGGRLAGHLEDISILLLQYVSNHRDEFGMPDQFWRQVDSK